MKHQSHFCLLHHIFGINSIIVHTVNCTWITPRVFRHIRRFDSSKIQSLRGHIATCYLLYIETRRRYEQSYTLFAIWYVSFSAQLDPKKLNRYGTSIAFRFSNFLTAWFNTSNIYTPPLIILYYLIILSSLSFKPPLSSSVLSHAINKTFSTYIALWLLIISVLENAATK